MRQGTWRQALGSLVVSVIFLLSLRWLVFEPYVIPSGSMLPTLRVLDFIFVNKFAYGIRFPFTSVWLWQRELPKRCDIVVFRSQTEPGVFLVKRVIGLPGERVELFESGRVRIDDVMLPTSPLVAPDIENSTENFSENRYRRFLEACDGDRSHMIQSADDVTDSSVDPIIYSVQVPDNHLVMFGDNRQASADSRVWGTLPRSEVLGKAMGIWLSCEQSLPGLTRVCDPKSLRWNRMFRDFDKVTP